MTEVSIADLRKLRERARQLLKCAEDDLKPFLHSDGRTFRRKPDSQSLPNDVNVTTTCSCLMALSLTHKLANVYDTDSEAKAYEYAREAFNMLVDAPWMSSGLTQNNAFTTTLVIRTLGFLSHERVLEASEVNKPDRKEWEAELGISSVKALVNYLRDKTNPASVFIWRSLSDDARRRVEKWKPTRTSDGIESRLRSILVLELGRLIQTWIYEQSRFPRVSTRAVEVIRGSTTTYQLASANHALLVESFPNAFAPARKRSLADIAAEMGSDEVHFRINDYPESAALVYWFVDGVARAHIHLHSRTWERLCNWAADAFARERSLVAAGHTARMDPVAMAMSACLCSRLRDITSSPASTPVGKLGAKKECLAILPSRAELEHSIRSLWDYQTNGIWPKYFPLFHYQDAGSNFCFTYELLEAILVEFGRSENGLLDDEAFVSGLQKAVAWCEDNRLKWSDGSTTYSGWNSGGYLETLRKDQPESWATAVVHMFLWEMDQVLSARIRDRLLRQYEARLINAEAPGVSSLLDIEIMEKGVRKSLKRVLQEEIVNRHAGIDDHKLANQKLKSPRSALLFGPPGTSKTKITEAVARDLGWHLIQIDPSHFLRDGLPSIYIEADKIFKDLLDLSRVLVLFDEMDALVQTRDGALKLDTAAQFLTTFMLPKLTALHEQGKVIFFMATNFQERFDAAIKRAGRFDLLLCMGPPTLRAKLKSLHVFTKQDNPTPETQRAAQLISELARRRWEAKLQLELYTFGEFRGFVRKLSIGPGGMVAQLEAMSPDDFAQAVKDDSKDAGLRLQDLSPLFKSKPVKCRTLGDLDILNIARKDIADADMTPIIRFVFDRRESKQQD